MGYGIYSRKNEIKKLLKKTKKNKIGRAVDRPLFHNGGPIDKPSSTAKADKSAHLEREGGVAGRPFRCNGGAMGPSHRPSIVNALRTYKDTNIRYS